MTEKREVDRETERQVESDRETREVYRGTERDIYIQVESDREKQEVDRETERDIETVRE